MSQEKLIKFTNTSWHYKLFNFVYRNAFGSPESFTNLCPYFWLVMAAIIIVPFKLALYYPLYYIAKGLYEINTMLAKSWLDKQSDKTIIQYQQVYDYNANLKATKRLPLWVYLYLHSISKTPVSYHTTLSEVNTFDGDAYAKLLKEATELANNNKIKKIKSKIQKKNKVKIVRDKIILYLETKIDDAFNYVSNIRDSFVISISSVPFLIKFAKRTVGVIISLMVAFCYSFIVYLIFALINLAIMYWEATLDIFLITLAVLAGIGIIFGIIYALKSFYNKLNDTYYGINSTWYTRAFIWTYEKMIMPFIEYIIVKPIVFVFYLVLWRIVLVGFIFGIFKGLVNGFKFTFSIFGEYFDSSYGDYCPGVEWEVTDKK